MSNGNTPTVKLWPVIAMLVGLAVVAFGGSLGMHQSQAGDIDKVRSCKVEKIDYRDDKAVIQRALERIEARQVQMIREIGRSNGH